MISIRQEHAILNKRVVWIISMPAKAQYPYTLLLSKVSEAIKPMTENNHIGEGASMNDFLKKQKGVRFIINAGFNHYRHNFYFWPHQRYHLGDPVGLVKIREHYFEDTLTLDGYGFFTQKDKNHTWKIQNINELSLHNKYILGCTPLLIHNKKSLDLNTLNMTSSQRINPPSFLGHGKENHARTCVGLENDQLYFILVEECDGQGGCTLAELQEIGTKLNFDFLLNLDGGGSSQFQFWNGEKYIGNKIEKKDQERILGHVIVLFDKTLI